MPRTSAFGAPAPGQRRYLAARHTGSRVPDRFAPPLDHIATAPAIPIAGAGPAGLSAALTIARAGGRAEVFERRARPGARFHGDFQGLENWSTERDVLDELASLGIAPTFDATPFYECTLFDPDGRPHVCRGSRPLWYLVRRGPQAGTVDDALARQAAAAGVRVHYGEGRRTLPDGGIAAHGPRRAKAIAVGYVFTTNAADGAYAVVSNALAPFGYAYLLVCGGRGTIASCMFAGFRNERRYLERTVDFFDRAVGVRMREPRRFGGVGSMDARPTLRRGRVLFAGEAAGLQDCLFGFGIRMALLSGHYAGAAYASGDLDAYAPACRARLTPLVRAAAVNRLLYLAGGARGYRRLIARVARAPDARDWLRRYYGGTWWKRPLFPAARLAMHRVGPSAP